jgi:hypothetical protein
VEACLEVQNNTNIPYLSAQAVDGAAVRTGVGGVGSLKDVQVVYRMQVKVLQPQMSKESLAEALRNRPPNLEPSGTVRL